MSIKLDINTKTNIKSNIGFYFMLIVISKVKFTVNI